MRDRWQEDQEARSCGVVQLRPGQLDLFQLAEAIRAEVVNGSLVARPVRFHTELTIEARPAKPHRAIQREGPIGDPHVEIKAQRRALHGREGVHVERHRVVDDLIEEIFAEPDLAVPQYPLIRALRVPPELTPVGDGRGNELLTVLVLVDQPDTGVKEALHLVAEASVCFAVAAVDAEFPHEIRQRVP